MATLTHIVNSNEGLYDYTVIHKPVKIGDVMKVGKLRVYFEKEGKEQVKLILDNVQYIPNFWVNLFSLMVAMSKSCTISNEGQAISLKLKFNDKIKTQNGFVCRIILQVKPTEDVSFVAIVNQVCQDINNLHHKLGHALESIV